MSLNNVDELMPDFRYIKFPASTKEQLLKNKAIAIYAFIHCKEFEAGDVSFGKGADNEIAVLNYDDFPDTFNEFYEYFKRIEANEFHARFEMSDYVSIALISSNYDFMTRIHALNDDELMIHPGLFKDSKVLEKIIEQTISNANLLREGYELPHLKKHKNPDVLINKFSPKQDGKIHINFKNKHLDPDANDNYFEYACFSEAYNFKCLSTIECCGKCKALKKMYEDVLEAVDDETACELKNIVEKTELFKGEDGYCKKCVGNYECNFKIRNAINYINCAFIECFDIK